MSGGDLSKQNNAAARLVTAVIGAGEGFQGFIQFFLVAAAGDDRPAGVCDMAASFRPNAGGGSRDQCGLPGDFPVLGDTPRPTRQCGKLGGLSRG